MNRQSQLMHLDPCQCTRDSRTGKIVDYDCGRSLPRGEIQTCSSWRGNGLALYELEGGGTRHRWHCLECDKKGPAEVDGAVCKQQLKHHMKEHVIAGDE